MLRSSEVNKVLEAFREMRSGILLLFIGLLVIVIGALSSLSMLLAIFLNPAVALVGGISLIIAVLVGFIIVLIGAYAKFYPGVQRLASIDPDYKTSATLIKLGWIYGVILGVIASLMSIIVWFAGLALSIIALVLLILGFVGLIVLCFKLYKKEGMGLYLAAGILFVLFFIPFCPLVAWILLYIALGESIEKMARMVTTSQPPTT